MSDTNAIAAHWASGDIYAMIVDTLRRMGKPLDRLSVEDLAPVDHFHARGLAATVALADRLPVAAGQTLVDIGCGLGGPARYLAQRFDCRVVGVDITAPFVDAANRLSDLLGMSEHVHAETGDGQRLPFADAIFDGALSQHVTMNVADRGAFFAEAFRVLKPGAFLALTEHGLGRQGAPHYPLPWSEDGSGAFLVEPEATQAALGAAGFVEVSIEETGEWYLAGYRAVIEREAQGKLPPLGVHLLMGDTAAEKMRNAARNIAEGRTRPIQVIGYRPR